MNHSEPRLTTSYEDSQQWGFFHLSLILLGIDFTQAHM